MFCNKKHLVFFLLLLKFIPECFILLDAAGNNFSPSLFLLELWTLPVSYQRTAVLCSQEPRPFLLSQGRLSSSSFLLLLILTTKTMLWYFSYAQKSKGFLYILIPQLQPCVCFL